MAKQAIIFPSINFLAKHFLVLHSDQKYNVRIPASYSSKRLGHKLLLEKHLLKIKLTSCSRISPRPFCGLITEKVLYFWLDLRSFRSQWGSFSGYGWAQSHFFTWASFKLALPTGSVLQNLSSLPARNMIETVVFTQCSPRDFIFGLLHDVQTVVASKLSPKLKLLKLSSCLCCGQFKLQFCILLVFLLLCQFTQHFFPQPK